MLKYSDSSEIVKHVCEEIIEKISDKNENSVGVFTNITAEEAALILYPLPSHESVLQKNKRFLSDFLKIWGERVGIPFVDSITITALNVQTKKISFDPTTIESISKKRKNEDANNSIESSTNENVDLDTAPSESKEIAPKKKKKGKKKAIASPKEEAPENIKCDEQVGEEPEEESEKKMKKSVTWGKPTVKPFFKTATICSMEEAKKSPVIKSHAPKVLKPGLVLPLASATHKSKKKRNKRI